jgi:hypothetical protein
MIMTNTMRELTAEELSIVSGGCCDSCGSSSCWGFDSCPALNMTLGSGGSGGAPGLLQS